MAGAQAPRGPGRALLGPDGPAVSLLRLDSPSGRSPGWRDRPEAVAARTLRQAAPCPCLLSSLWVSALGAWCAGLAVCTRVLGPSEGRTQFWRGVCANVGRARTCRHGFACVAAAYGSACWGARAPQRQRTEHGDTRKPAGSGAAAAPKPGWLRAPGTTDMGGAGGRKVVKAYPATLPPPMEPRLRQVL